MGYPDEGKCYQLYQELLELAKEQATLCDQVDFEEDSSLLQIKELLSKRQKLINAIDAVKGNDIGKTESEGLKNIIQQILAIDQKSIQYFSQQRTIIQQKIGKIQRGKQSNKAYEPYALQSDGYFVDQKK